MVWLLAWLGTGQPGLDEDGICFQQVYNFFIETRVDMLPVLDLERGRATPGKYRFIVYSEMDPGSQYDYVV